MSPVDPGDRARDQLALPHLDEAGQRRLETARVLLVRVGGLGGPAALELAAAGVGLLRIAHGGTVEPAHRNRMVCMSDGDIGRPAAPAAAEGIRRVNGSVAIETHAHDITTVEDARPLVDGVDLVVSAPPATEARMAVNRACVEARVPLVDAAMWGWSGQLLAVDPGRTGCLACLCPEPAPLERPFPVLGAVSGVVGCAAAALAVQLLVGMPGERSGTLWRLDLDRWRVQGFRVPRRAQCCVCG